MVNFAIVREDPNIEVKIIKDFSLSTALLIGSGGCTGLKLSNVFPNLTLSLFDKNPEQIKLIKEKVKNVTNINYLMKLSNQGLFESLFCDFSNYLVQHLWKINDLKHAISNNNKDFFKQCFARSAWHKAFYLFFNDRVLIDLFSPAACQYAQSDSYIHYFKSKIEKSILRYDISSNYHIQHIFLSHYQSSCTPSFFGQSIGEINLIEGDIYSVENLQNFQLIQLSNIFDWLDQEQSKKIIEYLNKHVKKGSLLLIRQLNNNRPLATYLDQYEYLDGYSKKLTQMEETCLYQRVLLFKKK